MSKDLLAQRRSRTGARCIRADPPGFDELVTAQSFDPPAGRRRLRLSPARMHPLPRILAPVLLVVLAALLAVLVAPAWTRARGEAEKRETGASSPARVDAPASGTGGAAAAATTTRMVRFRERTVLALGAAAFGLAVVLAFSLTLRPQAAGGAKPPLDAVRTEMNTLARLAQNSVAQGAELSRERDVRRRAEEDATLKQQLLAQSLEERIRLGRDLHDGIIQSLYAVGLTLEAARAMLRTDADDADRRLEQARSAINDTIRDVRTYITGLAPENLRRAGFAQALDSLLTELQASRDTRFDVKIDDEAAARFSADQGLQVLQILREAVSNALRHGCASLITLRVHQSDREVCLLVQDNGIGFAAGTRRPGGNGVGNMHARAKALGAELRITSQPGEGTRIVATIPIVQPAVT